MQGANIVSSIEYCVKKDKEKEKEIQRPEQFRISYLTNR
jgi:hypothetical protein